MEQLRRICQILKLDPRYLLNLSDFNTITEDDLKLLKDIKQLIRDYSK